MRSIFLLAASSLLLFSSCREIFAKRIRGNGNVVTQTRSAGNFNSIDVSGSINVYVKQDSTPSIKVEADDNLQEYIETIDEGDVLRIRTREGFNIRSSSQVKVYVSSPTFKKFEASGACDIFSDGQISNASEIEIDLSGSCNATMDLNTPRVSSEGSGATTLSLKGQTKDLSVEGSGSTNIKCLDLLSQNVELDLSGAGDAELNASTKISGSISGSADVRYKGNAQTDIHTSGASSVRKID